MTDLSPTIAPKSDQLNSDDLIAGPMTVTVTKVSATQAKDQPIAVFFEGDNGKPYKPCKSMRRVMVAVWGKQGEAYVGRSMTLYRDPTVTWGGIEVGGIRISHMSHIKEPVTMALTASKASRKPYTVKPLIVQNAARQPSSSPDPADAQQKAGASSSGAPLPDTGPGSSAEYPPPPEFPIDRDLYDKAMEKAKEGKDIFALWIADRTAEQKQVLRPWSGLFADQWRAQS